MIAMFAIDPSSGSSGDAASFNGRLAAQLWLRSTGCFLLVANQRSDSILSFRVDGESAA
jgi:6-phosphogluconolactonase (cycloisomerase 2 family)